MFFDTTSYTVKNIPSYEQEKYILLKIVVLSISGRDSVTDENFLTPCCKSIDHFHSLLQLPIF